MAEGGATKGQTSLSIGLAVVGAVVGGYLGGPQGAALGASLGLSVGGIVGGIAFPGEVKGPRAEDTQEFTSVYGKVRPTGDGTNRMSGNVIWAGPLVEKRHTASGGKGGPKQITYTYYRSWAIDFGEGPADDVLRIWFDDELVYDKTQATGSSPVLKTGINFRFYKGDGNNDVDPAISADKGADRTPGFKYSVLLIFDNIPLADYYNRIPFVSAEIANGTTELKLQEIGTNITGGDFTDGVFAGAGMAVDLDRGYVFVVGDNTVKGIRRFDLHTMTEDLQKHPWSVSEDEYNSLSTMICTPDGDIICSVDTVDGPPFSTNSYEIVLLDGNTLEEKARFGTPGSSLSMSSTEWINLIRMQILSAVDTYGQRVDYLLGTSAGSLIGLLKLPTLEYIYSESLSSRADWPSSGAILGITRGQTRNNGDGEGWITVFDENSSGTFAIYKLSVNAIAIYSLIPLGVEIKQSFTFDPEDFVSGQTSMGSIGGHLVYDETSNSLIFAITNTSPSIKRWAKIDIDTGQIAWVSDDVSGMPYPDGDTWKRMASCRLRGHTFGYMYDNKGVLLNTITGEILFDNVASTWARASYDYGIWDSDSQSWIGYTDATGDRTIGRWYFNRVTKVPATLSDVVTRYCERVGLTASDIDVTALTDTVEGFAIGAQVSARSILDSLASYFFFDGVESDWKLKFVKRGGASVRTITEDELIVVDESSGSPITSTRQEEIDLPRQVTVGYQDKDKDFQPGVASSRRISNPTASMSSNQIARLDYPGVSIADTAKQTADKALYAAWSERNGFSTRLSPKHLDLDPTDVVTIARDDGVSHLMRLIQTGIVEGYAVEASGVGQTSNNYTSAVTAYGGEGLPSRTIQADVFMKTLILDVPLLRDGDEPAGRTTCPLYFFMGGYRSGQFRRGALFRSLEGQVYDQVGTVVQAMNWGTVTNTLSDPPYGPFATDDVNTLMVVMSDGGDELESVTYAQMLNGSNPAAIIKANGEIEIIQYQTVTQNADGSFTLSGLFRGRRGTDTMCYDHANGEIFLMLIPSDGGVFSLQLTEIDAVRYYKGVHQNQLFEQAEVFTLTSEGRALMPYAPYNEAATFGTGNDIDLTWERRSRIASAYQGSTSIGLYEDSEAYEVDILDGPGGSVVRTVTGLSSATTTYTESQQSTDGFSPPLSQLTIMVYQVSAQVGRGFSNEVTLNVQ